jgi:hypothetical protein
MGRESAAAERLRKTRADDCFGFSRELFPPENSDFSANKEGPAGFLSVLEGPNAIRRSCLEVWFLRMTAAPDQMK